MKSSKANILATWAAWRKHVGHAQFTMHIMHIAMSRLRDHSKAKAWQAWMSDTLNGARLNHRAEFHVQAKLKSSTRHILQVWNGWVQVSARLRWGLDRAQKVGRSRRSRLSFRAWYALVRCKAGDSHIMASHKLHALPAKRLMYACIARHGCGRDTPTC